ncbi:MAG: hypothetical protein U0821_19885 [Chloroflexota bacterium]
MRHAALRVSTGFLAASVACGLLLGTLPAARAQNAPPPLTGTIAAPRSSGWVFINPETGAERFVAVSPPTGVSGHVALTADGSRVALSRFAREPGERVGGADILIVGAAGGQGTVVATHGSDGALLGAPSWTPDGYLILFDSQPPNGGPPTSRVEYVTTDGAARREVTGGAWPVLSPDWRTLAFVRTSPKTGDLNELVAVPVEGGAPRVVVPADQFVQIISPRFSPDGQTIAFVGSDTRGEARDGEPPEGALAMGVMRHGPPGDIWMVPLDGGPSWRRTAFEEDDPTLAWSPDGQWLALLSGGGLYVVHRDGQFPPRVIGPGGFGGIDWR